MLKYDIQYVNRKIPLLAYTCLDFSTLEKAIIYFSSQLTTGKAHGMDFIAWLHWSILDQCKYSYVKPWGLL